MSKVMLLPRCCYHGRVPILGKQKKCESNSFSTPKSSLEEKIVTAAKDLFKALIRDNAEDVTT